MERKTILFIYNPMAGKEIMRNKLSVAVEQFMEDDYAVTIYATRKSGDATVLVEELSEKFDRIVCAGGDGTLHEVMGGLMSISPEKRRPCGYIPTGTVNDFARSMHIPKDVKKAAMIAARGNLLPYDIGCMNGRYFNYIAAFGAFTSVAYQTPHTTKNILGKGAYFLQGLMELPTIHGYKMVIEYDEGVLSGDFIYGMITNAKSVGGFSVFKKTPLSLNDGLFEGVFVKNPKNPLELNAVVTAFMGGNANAQIMTVRSSHFEIQVEEEASFTLDGEDGGKCSHVIIDNCSKAVTYLKKERKPTGV